MSDWCRPSAQGEPQGVDEFRNGPGMFSGYDPTTRDRTGVDQCEKAGGHRLDRAESVSAGAGMCPDLRAVGTSAINPAEAGGRPLGLPGRVAVIALVAVALVVGLASGTGLFEAAPYGLVGGFLAIRRPRSSIGWLLLLGACSFAVSSLNAPASLAELTSGAVSPAVMAITVVQAWSGSPLIVVLFVITLTFPAGRLPVGRWGQLARSALALVVLLAVLSVFAPTISVNIPSSSSGVSIANPLAVFPDWPGWIALSAGPPVTLLFTAVGVASMFVRLRRARGVERAQLRWLVWSMAFIVVGFLIGLVGDSVFVNGLGGVVWLPAIVAFCLPPVAIGIAILRYRLYEIDRIISRTISYGVITLVLVSVFVVVVLAAQEMLGPLTGSNTIAVAGSTLLVATLFQPLRRRIQRLVDRRFNRTRYDADRIAAALTKRLGDEVDLETLRSAILATVGAAVEPSSEALWLRE
jgi:hypothetical protein